jgi:hypothetical protein
MQHPMDAINEETISVSLNGDETMALLKAIAVYASLLPTTELEEGRVLLALVEKLGPGIEEKAAKQMRLLRDGLN